MIRRIAATLAALALSAAAFAQYARKTHATWGDMARRNNIKVQ